jgi:hypothetical protein
VGCPARQLKGGDFKMLALFFARARNQAIAAAVSRLWP